MKMMLVIGWRMFRKESLPAGYPRVDAHFPQKVRRIQAAVETVTEKLHPGKISRRSEVPGWQAGQNR
jgi:hypothetical protein